MNKEDKVKKEENLEDALAEQTADNNPEDEPKDSELKEAALINEIAELKDKFLRLNAEFDNFRKRTIKEKSELIYSANEQLIISLLPIIDDFERAVKSFETTQEIDQIKEGITLVYNKFNKALQAKGVKPLISIGETFDAEIHEAITQIPVQDESQKGRVVDEIEKGYYLHDKLIRVAKVVIGN